MTWKQLTITEHKYLITWRLIRCKENSIQLFWQYGADLTFLNIPYKSRWQWIIQIRILFNCFSNVEKIFYYRPSLEKYAKDKPFEEDFSSIVLAILKENLHHRSVLRYYAKDKYLSCWSQSLVQLFNNCRDFKKNYLTNGHHEISTLQGNRSKNSSIVLFVIKAKKSTDKEHFQKTTSGTNHLNQRHIQVFWWPEKHLPML